ncbi:hypothetical protein [Reyranella sp.]|uniref:hypothetical protein n=1 Tax=Reyranella sp. TaxID=1929291 RepID=UPI003C7E5FDB
MRPTFGFLTTLAAVAAAALSLSPARAATIGGTFYAVQYDFQEFWTATDGKSFRVVLAGNPFPALPPAQAAAGLLPVMQTAKPRPALTFTYDTSREEPRPDYRLVLVSNAANDLNGDTVCKGTTRFKPGPAGIVNLFAVYCRNDMAMSMATASTPASSPDDPKVSLLFRELFMVVFSDTPALKPNAGGMGRR